MKSQTSNAVFLGGVVAGIALVSLIAVPASATEAAPAQSQVATATNAVETVCIEDMCYDVPETQVEIITEDIPVQASDSVVIDAAYTPRSDGLLIVRDDFDEMDTLVGRIDRSAPGSAADSLLPGSGHLPQNDQIRPVESVTGVGLRRTF